MKKIFLVLLSLCCLAGCVQTYTVQKESNISVIDLSKYSDNGFFISETPFFGNYVPISIFRLEIIPESQMASTYTTDQTGHLEQYGSYYSSNEAITYGELIDSVYSAGIRCNANGAVSLKFSESKVSDGRKSYVAEGLFIKK